MNREEKFWEQVDILDRIYKERKLMLDPEDDASKHSLKIYFNDEFKKLIDKYLTKKVEIKNIHNIK